MKLCINDKITQKEEKPMAGNETHDNAASSSADVRWWHLPFDTSTNFSLLGFVLEEYLDEPDSGKKVDMDLK